MKEKGTAIELDQETQKMLELLSNKTGMKPEQIATEALLLFKKERIEPREKDFMKELEKDMVEVKLTLYKPFYNFMKEYLEFFGSKQTIEDLCRLMIMDDVKHLYRSIGQFLDGEITHLEGGSWFNK